MLDFTSVLSEVSVLFQTEDILLIEIMPSLETAVLNLQNLKYHPGENLVHFMDDLRAGNLTQLRLKGTIDTELIMEPLYEQMIEAAIDFIQSRFSALNKAPFSLFQMFDFTIWPYNQENLAVHGNTELNQLLQHFEELFDEVRRGIVKEWPYFKTRVIKLRNEKFSDV